MTPASPVPASLPETVDTSKFSAEKLAMLSAPKNPTLHLRPFTPIAKTPEVAAEKAELTDMFAAVLTPEEVAFHTPVKPPPPKQEAPRNFLQAHMIIIDQLLMDPTITMTKLASVTGYSRAWLHKLMSSDAFQAKLSERQKAIIDPIVHATIKERVSGLISRSLEVLEERMESDKIDLPTALEVFSTLQKSPALGLQQKGPTQTQNFIVHVPPQMSSATDWAKDWGKVPGGPGAVTTIAEPLDVQMVEVGAAVEGEGDDDGDE